MNTTRATRRARYALVLAAIIAFVPAQLFAQPVTTLRHRSAAEGGFGACTALAINASGRMFGTTGSGGAYGWGTLYALNADGSGFQVLRSFDPLSDGASPQGGVIVGADGRIYGATYRGGPADTGAVFRIDADGTNFTVLHSFSYSDGRYLSGVAQGTDGKLYGAAANGGAYGYGSLFKLNTDGSGFTVIYSFNYPGPHNPNSPLIVGTDGKLYGSLANTYNFSYGSLYKINTDGSGFAIVHDFTGTTDGGGNSAGLMQAGDGTLYGTSASGTGSFGGEIFKLNPDGTGFTTLHSFDFSQPEGGYPLETVPILADGRLYGSSGVGGAGGWGSVWSLKPDGTDFKIEASFNYTNGAGPNSGVRQGPDGGFYGTTNNGGSLGYGTVFRLRSGDTVPPVLTLPDPVVAEATSPAGAVVTFTVSANDDVDGPVAAIASPASGSTFAFGTTTVTVTATDAAGNASTGSFTVTVRDTTAPVITSVTPSIAEIWPPNKKMVAVSLAASAADAVGITSLKIISVTTNEPDNNTQWQITGDLTVNLRADRKASGSGRVYTITVEARDAANNASTATTIVTVPHDRGG